HEITDNWDEGTDLPYGHDKICYESTRCAKSKNVYLNAMTAYSTFLGNTNPKPYFPLQADAERGVHYYYFTYGTAAFFVIDNRAFRDLDNENDISADSRTMLGGQQISRLFQWLLDV